MYLIDIVISLVSPYINWLWNMFELFAIQAPIRELRVRETDAKNVAADTFDDRTSRAIETFLFSAC